MVPIRPRRGSRSSSWGRSPSSPASQAAGTRRDGRDSSGARVATLIDGLADRLAGRIRGWAPAALGVLFVGSGLLHLVRPGTYLALIPPILPAPNAIIVVSGLAELTCAAGLLRRASWAGPASAVLLLAVFPGNVWFALATSANPAADPTLVALAWARLPLQAPLIWAALQARRR